MLMLALGREDAGAQATGRIVCEGILVKGDTFALFTLPLVKCVTKKAFGSIAEESNFYQTKKNITDMWPYAQAASKIFNEVLAELADKNSKRDQKKFLKEEEAALKTQFEDKLKDLYDTQGAVLMKLIARNTGHSVYDLIKQFKSGPSAFVWNTMGKLNGYDLKYEYDPTDDRDFEFICQQLEDLQKAGSLAAH